MRAIEFHNPHNLQLLQDGCVSTQNPPANSSTGFFCYSSAIFAQGLVLGLKFEGIRVSASLLGLGNLGVWLGLGS